MLHLSRSVYNNKRNGDRYTLYTDELKRSINLFQAIIYGVGLILGAGIYVIIEDVAAIAGNAMWISFILAALIAIVTGFSYAELSSIFPKSAAEYVYSKNAFDSNFVGSIAGLCCSSFRSDSCYWIC